ncbi:thiamine phosphate synthase [Novosphingobium sp.]|uniref:thiamine phosphate synthase n=2 Tax=Novosphingobium TaxID=165696 RepID=UPI00191C226E|nr:thiamine phosphate synthase [Novosphingobium sp.]
MTRCYSAMMGKRQSAGKTGLPRQIVLSDARNDGALSRALARMPRGGALVFRHYHLAGPARLRRFRKLRAQAGARGHKVIGARLPQHWRCDGVYGTAREVAGKAGLRLATAHSLREIGMAVRARADAILLSPVFPTRSHPGGGVLGPVRFLLLARQSPLPVIALGGMTRARAARLPVHGWAAIDGMAAT